MRYISIRDLDFINLRIDFYVDHSLYRHIQKLADEKMFSSTGTLHNLAQFPNSPTMEPTATACITSYTWFKSLDWHDSQKSTNKKSKEAQFMSWCRVIRQVI